jgi:hypothetical protein
MGSIGGGGLENYRNGWRISKKVCWYNGSENKGENI